MATHSSISCLENSMDTGAWWLTVLAVAKSQTGKKERKEEKSHLTLCDPVDCSPPSSSIHEGKNTGVGCHFLLQGIFPTQRSNPGLPHCRQTQTQVLPIAGRCFNLWVTREALLSAKHFHFSG